MLEGQEGEVQTSGEITEAAPEPQTTSQETSQPRSEAPQETQTKTEDTSKLPFNDPRSPHHERFKELMDQRNEERKARSQLENQLKDLQRQFQASQRPPQAEDPMVKKLKDIDPEFGKDYEALKGSLKEIEQLKAWKAEADKAAVRAQYQSTVSKLHTDNKVSAELQRRYEAELEATIRANPQMTMEDLPQAYKAIHDDYSKIFSAREKAAIDKYLASKAKDTGVAPPQGKGKSVPTSGEPKFSGNREQDRALLIQRVLKMSKTSNSS